MRTCYEGHDRAYQAKRRRGDTGWTSEENSAESFARIEACLADGVSEEWRILDLGCGSGELTCHYAGLCRQVTGIDLSPTAIAWAREKVPGAEFVCDNVLNPAALPVGRYNVVIDSNCLHCIIGDDRKVLLANIAHWLVPEGLLLLHTMANDPVGALQEGYDPADRIIYQGDIATRYLGRAEDILREVAESGFQLLRHTVHQQIDGPDMLVSLHRKPA